MKKKFLKFVYLTCAAIIGGFMFASCSDDDDDNGGNGNGKIDPSSIAESNLIAYFPFDGNTNEMISSRTADNHGVTFIDGRRGKAYQGSSTAWLSYNLLSNDKLKDAKAYTVSMWVKSPQLFSPLGACIFMQANGGDPNMGSIVVGLQDIDSPSDTLRIKNYLYSDAKNWKGQGWDYSSIKFPANKWIHLVCMYDNATSAFRIFVDGKFVADNVRYGDGGTPPDQPLLGDLKLINMTKLYFGIFEKKALGTSTDTWMDNIYSGNLDEVRLYDRSLTDSEVGDLYYAEATQLND